MYHRYVFVLFFSPVLRYVLLNPLNDIQIHRLPAVYSSPWTLEPTINPLLIAIVQIVVLVAAHIL
jgi:hypothetical protein